MDRRYEGNLINASENKKRVRITTSAKHAAPIIFFFCRGVILLQNYVLNLSRNPIRCWNVKLSYVCFCRCILLYPNVTSIIVLLSYLCTASFDFPSRLECTELDCDVFFAVRHEHPRTWWKKPVFSFVFFMANTLFIEKYIRRNSKTSPNDQQNLNSYLTN